MKNTKRNSLKDEEISNLQSGGSELGRTGGINTGSDIHPSAQSNMDGRTITGDFGEIRDANNEFNEPPI